jgi:hypothetical protein
MSDLAFYETCGHMVNAVGKPVANFSKRDKAWATHVLALCPNCPKPKLVYVPPLPWDEQPLGGGTYGGPHR